MHSYSYGVQSNYEELKKISYYVRPMNKWQLILSFRCDSVLMLILLYGACFVWKRAEISSDDGDTYVRLK